MTSLSFSQSDEFYSLYFSSDEVDGYKEATISSAWYGEYILKENDANGMRVAAGESIFIDESGVYIEKNKVLSISREEVRENSKYTVTNGFLHGVLENDSLMVSQDGELFYFLMPSKAYLFESSAKLFKLSADKFIFFSSDDNRLFVPTIIERKNTGLQLYELIYPNEIFDFRSVKEQFTIAGSYTTYVVDPNKEEWDKIIVCFQLYESYLAK